EDFVPHRPPMLLIDDIVEVSDDHAICHAVIKPGCVFLRDGVVHASAMIEVMAQCCAVVASARSSIGKPRLGLIVSCREVEFAVDSFAIGDQLVVTAKRVHGQHQLAVFACSVVRNDQVCATMQLSAADAELVGAEPTA
ncbi:MAG TPA: hypothetical protein VGO00_22895, partial [Kofleriaceae bacterium]|nr:hypothetical protein [Kofleriaceae bacterium]